MSKYKWIQKIYSTLRSRMQLIKLMAFILGVSSISIALTQIIIRIESSRLNTTGSNAMLMILRQHNLIVNTCNPVRLVNYHNNNQQYYVVIDGVRYPKQVPSFFNRSIDFDCLNADYSSLKTILLWNWSDDFSYGLGIREPFIINQCPVVNCELTDDKEKLVASDYVLVKYKHDLEFRDLPRQANPKTRLTLYMPYPILDLSAAKKFNRVFNSTATYHIHSHILPYYLGRARFFWSPPNDLPQFAPPTAQIQHPNKLKYFHLKRSVAALVDFDCSSLKSKAQKYINYLKQLNETIPVRIFGGCGRSCDSKCRERIYQTYKFTLIYEPLMRCAGYVNEMFLDAFAYETIPVVFNRSSSYEFFVPASAFVKAYEFGSSAKSLGAYLRSIEDEPQKALGFFEWKQHIKFTPNVFGSFCDLCIRAHLERNSNVSYVVDNLQEFLKCQ